MAQLARKLIVDLELLSCGGKPVPQVAVVASPFALELLTCGGKPVPSRATRL